MNSAARAMLVTMLVAGAVSATAVQCMAEEVPQYQLSFGTFVSPRDIKLGPAGHVYIADAGNSRVREYTHDGQFVSPDYSVRREKTHEPSG